MDANKPSRDSNPATPALSVPPTAGWGHEKLTPSLAYRRHERPVFSMNLMLCYNKNNTIVISHGASLGINKSSCSAFHNYRHV